MKHYAFLLLTLLMALTAQTQTTFCPGDPPLNSHLVDSPYPIYHRNNYAQASTCIAGPVAGDSLIIKKKTNIRGGTSPWVYLSDKYPTGERILFQSNASFIYKFIDDGTTIQTVDSFRIDFDIVTSFGWNFLLGKNHTYYTYDPKYDPANGESTRLFKFTDVDTTTPYSDFLPLDTFDFGTLGMPKVQHYSINYDGDIVFHSEKDTSGAFAILGIMDQNFNVKDTLHYSTTPDEEVRHNAFAVDEHNSMFAVSTKAMRRFDWDGTNLSLAWEAPYDFVNDGPTGNFAKGSGTTPTLMGWGAGNDKLVLVADGHDKNNLVAFWRELPAGWTGIPGMATHFADSIRIPFAESFGNTFQSIENSPTVFHYDVAIAQFNGFLGYPCTNLKGVQKFAWDTTANHFNVAWATDSINMNGVLCYSEGSNMVYGSGKEDDCNYYYYGLDWDSGALLLRKLLGPEGGFNKDTFYDAGNNNIIDEEGNIYFPGGSSLVKLENVGSVMAWEEGIASDWTVYPNPSYGTLKVFGEAIERVVLYDMQGRQLGEYRNPATEITVPGLEAGLYMVEICGQGQRKMKKILVR